MCKWKKTQVKSQLLLFILHFRQDILTTNTNHSTLLFKVNSDVSYNNDFVIATRNFIFTVYSSVAITRSLKKGLKNFALLPAT